MHPTVEDLFEIIVGDENDHSQYVLKSLASKINHYSLSVNNGSEADPPKPGQLVGFATSQMARFGLLGNINDLESAISHLDSAVLLTPTSHELRWKTLGVLGYARVIRFRYLGDLSDLEQAINCSTEALSLMSDDGYTSRKRLTSLSNLGNIFHTRFISLGDMLDLDRAIDYLQTAVSLSSERDRKMPDLLNKLGCAQRSRFEHLGNLADLDAAIAHQTRAVSLLSDFSSTKRGLLNNLGTSLRIRFDRLQDLKDIENAISYQDQAVQLSPDDHPDKAVCFASLGHSYGALFEYQGDPSYLDSHVYCLNRAVQLTPEGHPSKAFRLVNLGDSLSRRFDLRRDLTDVETAISYQVRALEIAPDDHPEKPNWLNNLGVSYSSRFQHLQMQPDIDNAISCINQALVLLPTQNPNRSIALYGLGHAYLDRFMGLGDDCSLGQAIHFFQMAAQLPSGAPLNKMWAAHTWATTSLLSPTRSPLEGFKHMVDLIPQIVWLGETVEDRYTKTLGIGELTAQAAASAIQLQAYDLALEWIEEGCSVVWKQMLQLRTPLDDLRAAYPELAKLLEDTARNLDQSSIKSQKIIEADSHALESAAQSHRRLAENYEQLLVRVRGLPGFSEFMRPKRANALKSAARHGAVVVINAHETRCDALVLLPGSDAITHVPLPLFSVKTAATIQRQLARYLHESSIKQRGFKSGIAASPDIMSILWRSIVEPVIKHLGYMTQSPGLELPRVTWCTSGPSAFLPLHAAGCYDEPRSKIFDYVMSSYTPTLSALLAAAPDPNSFRGILAVGQANTPGHPSLPETKAEVAQIQLQAGAHSVKVMTESHATVAAVTNAMQDYSWVHMACHASQNRSTPTMSGFHLHNGTLELEEIMKKSLKGKGLAFLSACETATGDDALPGEALHLAAGMLMAGYPSVIATMWSIHDQDAPLIAKIVYAHILEGGVADIRKTAKALHDAVACLRTKVGEKNFARWVPYIHFGL